jgi:hypothetical protein
MLPGTTLPLPGSLAGLMGAFAPLFTAPSFRAFCGLACGFLAQSGKRTVCGMLAGAGLARAWSHDRAHRFSPAPGGAPMNWAWPSRTWCGAAGAGRRAGHGGGR